MTADAAGLVACNLLFLAAGAGITRLLGAWRTPRGLVRTIGVAYLAGLAAVGVTLQLLLSLGTPFNRWVVLAVCLSLAASGVVARRPSDPPVQRIAFPAYLWPVLVALVAIVALMFVDLWFQPLGQWDAWAQWTAKARSLVIFHGVNTDLLTSAPYRAWNPDYPVLLPSLEAADFTFMRRLDTQAIHLQFGLIYAGFLLALLELLRGRAREVIVWPFVLAIAAAPAMQIQTATAIADVPVAVMFALSGLFAWRWLVDADRIALRLFALFAAGAYATKFEGRLFVGALSATLIVLIAVKERRRLVATIAAVVAALVGLVPWLLWAANHHLVGTLSTPSVQAPGERGGEGLPDKVGRLPAIVESLAGNVLSPSRWLLIGVVTVAAIVIAWRALPGRVEPWFVVTTFGVGMAGLVLVYLVSPLEVHAYLAHSARRVVTGPLLFATVLAPLLLESALQAPPRRKRDRRYPLPP